MARRTGIVCLLFALGVLALSLPLGCVPTALRVGGFLLADGWAFGVLLAAITRTRRPLFIYLSLAGAATALYPVFISWPPAEAWDVHPWRGAPDLVYYYFDAARIVWFLLGMPYPFVRWGQHGPDPIGEPESNPASNP